MIVRSFCLPSVRINCLSLTAVLVSENATGYSRTVRPGARYLDRKIVKSNGSSLCTAIFYSNLGEVLGDSGGLLTSRGRYVRTSSSY